MKPSFNQLLFLAVITLLCPGTSCRKQKSKGPDETEYYIRFTANGKSYLYNHIAFAQYDLSRNPNDRITPPYLALIAHGDGSGVNNQLIAIHLYSDQVKKNSGTYDAEQPVPPLNLISEASLTWVDEQANNYFAGVSTYNMDDIETISGFRPVLTVHVTELTAERIHGTFTAVTSRSESFFTGKRGPHPVQGEFNLPIVSVPPAAYEGNSEYPLPSGYHFTFHVAGQPEPAFSVTETNSSAILIPAETWQAGTFILSANSPRKFFQLMLTSREPFTTTTYVHTNYPIQQKGDVGFWLSYAVTDPTTNVQITKSTAYNQHSMINIDLLTDTEIKGTFNGLFTVKTKKPEGSEEAVSSPITEAITGSFYLPLKNN